MKASYFQDQKVKEQIDEKLHEMSILFSNTGQDSTLKEIKDAYKREWKIMDEIEEIDPEFGKIIRPYNDKEWTSITKS